METPHQRKKEKREFSFPVSHHLETGGNPTEATLHELELLVALYDVSFLLQTAGDVCQLLLL